MTAQSVAKLNVLVDVRNQFEKLLCQAANGERRPDAVLDAMAGFLKDVVAHRPACSEKEGSANTQRTSASAAKSRQQRSARSYQESAA
jgi:hypothetical protein